MKTFGAMRYAYCTLRRLRAISLILENSGSRLAKNHRIYACYIRLEEKMFRLKDQTEEIINLIWDREKYYLVTARDSAPSKKELKEFASKYGVVFPREYLAHASGYWGGLYLEVREEIWPRHKAGDVGPFWSFLYGIFVYAYSEDAPDWMQLKPAAEEFKEMGHQVIPFMKVIGDADVYCFDSKGEIQRWSHEEDSFEPYDGTFFDVLRHEFLELETRRKRKLTEQS